MMRVAVGGSDGNLNYWIGQVLAEIEDLKRQNQFNISFGNTTLDVTDTELNEVHAGSSPDTGTSWSEQAAMDKAEELETSGRHLLLAQAQSIDREYLNVLFEPITHMLIITEKEDSPEFEEWKDTAEAEDVQVTYHLMTDEDQDSVYWTDDENVLKIQIYQPGPIFTHNEPYRLMESEGIHKLAFDLVERAKDSY